MPVLVCEYGAEIEVSVPTLIGPGPHVSITAADEMGEAVTLYATVDRLREFAEQLLAATEAAARH